jgi:hypothetical protein
VECVQGADFLFGLCKGNFLAVFCGQLHGVLSCALAM